MKNLTLLPGLLAAILLAAPGGTRAQQIRGGVNLANVSTTSDGRVDRGSSLTSFQVGLIGNWKLGTSLIALQPGIVFTGKGAQVQYREPGQVGYFRQRLNPFYIEVPVNLVAKLPLGASSRFFVGAGPYAAVGIAGKVTTEGSALVGVNGKRSIQFSNDDPTTFNQEEGTGLGVLRRFDYGFNGTAGFEGSTTVIGVNYGLGLAKLQSGANSSADDANKHRVLSFFIGFKF
ncbi:outer membrane beta-barrel protein [Flaviaesturariibacter amylovorans]|uniref:Outer membrane protein beta-barrel domain-containing protein n=1 Tax=Flaviaesturariibacter amylovorans TaxID=1084520 RepID=A0ABP8GNV4_9BACT